MSLDYNVCDNCGEVTVNYEIRCESCGRHWCSYECSEEDGHLPTHCDKYGIYGETEVKKCREIYKCKTECTKCEYLVPNLCAYCRDEKFEDSELLKYALGLLRMTKEELILVVKNTKKTIKEYK